MARLIVVIGTGAAVAAPTRRAFAGSQFAVPLLRTADYAATRPGLDERSLPLSLSSRFADVHTLMRGASGIPSERAAQHFK